MKIWKITLMANSGAFSLPWFVAQTEGFFEAEGLEVQLLSKDPLAPEREIFHRKKESSLTQGRSDMCTVCEWGAFKRWEDSQDLRIMYVATKKSPYAIVVKDDSSIKTAAENNRCVRLPESWTV